MACFESGPQGAAGLQGAELVEQRYWTQISPFPILSIKLEGKSPHDGAAKTFMDQVAGQLPS